MSEEYNATQAGAAEAANEAGQERTYSQAEVEALLQKEGDKRVSEALKTHDKRWEARLEEAKSEAERLAKLSAKEKEAETLRMEREAIDKERAELNALKLRMETQRQLAERGLPDEMADFLVAGDAETTKAHIEAFSTAFDAAVSEAVRAKLQTQAPSAGNGAHQMTRDEINAIRDPAERLRAIGAHMSMYKTKG